MADDKLSQFEAIFGAISKIASGDEGGALLDARCPKCGASDFVEVVDLYSEAADRVAESPESAGVVHVGGLTDEEIVRRFAPPQRKSALVTPLFIAIPLAAAAFYVYRRFGETPGQFAGMGAGIITVAVLLTSLRKRSDE
ncbi:MAG TPA: hypothetical protein VIP11_10640, partial [Gemmatimonadaceae bacterium]